MRKIKLLIVVTLSLAALNSFAGDTKPQTKTAAKCPLMGGSCCKQTSRAALMKARAVKAVPLKKA